MKQILVALVFAVLSLPASASIPTASPAVGKLSQGLILQVAAASIAECQNLEQEIFDVMEVLEGSKADYLALKNAGASASNLASAKSEIKSQKAVLNKLRTGFNKDC
jgi:hypothetical protein